jgi:intracellular sulfur oxidation DsrE/DsrF family protein
LSDESVTTRPAGVVVHLAEALPERHRAVLQNVRNLRAALDDGIPVELVTHGPGVDLVVTGSQTRADLAAVVSSGVDVLACRNTLQARGLGTNDLLPQVGTVDSGVAHLARRQLAGWAYLRP